MPKQVQMAQMGLTAEAMEHALAQNDINNVLAVVLGSGREVDKALATLPLPEPLACHEGCYYCCHQQIYITIPEILLVTRYLETTQNGGRDKALATIKKTLAEHPEVSHQEKEVNYLPCVFLNNGACSIYPARPLHCHSWNSVDKDRCKEAYLTDKKVTRLEYTNLIGATDAVSIGITAALYKAGLQWGAVHIGSGVMEYFNHPNPTEAWLSGETVFTEAKSIGAKR